MIGYEDHIFSKITVRCILWLLYDILQNYEGWNFNSGNYLFTTDTK